MDCAIFYRPTFVPYSDPKATIPLGAVLNNDWFELWYQPKIELKTLHLVGAEALVRAVIRRAASCLRLCSCRAPAVMPCTRLPSGVILTALGDWEDFADGVPIRTLGQRAGVGSGRSSDSPNAARGSPARGELAGFDPWRLLKTRSFTICSWRKTLPTRCGNSNATSRSTISVQDTRRLSACTQLPFSELKIDRAYVANCSRDQFNAGLCETIVELGRRFGLRTVAEGIETAHESHKLQSIGCQIGQGFLFGKPMPKTQLVTRLRSCLNAQVA